MGKRIDLATLAAEPVVATAIPTTLADSPPRIRQVPVTTVAANPINPREDISDLSDLESMRTVGQLQACIVVTRSAFQALYPEHSEALAVGAEFVVVAGSRRRLAAEKFGLDTLDVVVRDMFATTRAGFYGASITENIDRQDFAPLEEARAIEQLIAECGNGAKAAELLGRSKGWISQRRALLRLSPTMQDFLRSGELLIRDARRLAALPPDEQEQAWRNEQQPDQPSAAPYVDLNVIDLMDGDDGLNERPEPEQAPVTAREPAARHLRIPLDATPTEVAAALREHYPRRHFRTVGRLLSDD